jgi:hypothetical protein|tara:strand:- start:22 stop:270 length:249 start_codon:yes stop_codon:yes gene_type:complete
VDTIVKSSKASALLSDPVLQEAFDVIKLQQVDVFKHHASSQEEIMEASRMVRALGAVEEQLKSFILNGKLLERRIEKGQHRG